MKRYLISFDDGAMTFPREDLPEVSRDSHAVVERARVAAQPARRGPHARVGPGTPAPDPTRHRLRRRRALPFAVSAC
ncbi:hypothetical protein [Cellulomonas sp. NS3]|uniref:hypothetical protein n=1 Tax=Cellulomonas sp. NS3 TaxID=2973977 RepID=UPI0021637B73|nr:hypothetical protein [Cellulomonas sp. NS3]